MTDITSMIHRSVIDLRIPQDSELQAAIGRVTAAHANLELVLKLCVKTLKRQDLQRTLAELGPKSTSMIRSKINTLARNATGNPDVRERVSALMEEARKLARKRNQLIHRPWGYSAGNELLAKDERNFWNDPPSIDELDSLTVAIADLTEGINHERLHGVIRQAAEEGTA